MWSGRGATNTPTPQVRNPSTHLLLLFHEVGHDRLALAEVLHGEGADLVEAHHFRHGGEDDNSVQLIPQRRHHLLDLLRQLLPNGRATDAQRMG